MLRSDNRAGSSTAFLALSCVSLIGAPTRAQTPPTEGDAVTELQGVTVTDTAINEGSYKVDKLDSPKATASLLNTPRSITVIPQQVIKDTASASLAEALRTVPGITMGAGEGGNPLGDRPFIRGADSQASTYLDGVRDIGAQTREIFAVESIEVTKGPDSSMGGRGNAGGSINLVSKMPTSERFAAATGVLGTANYKRATIDLNQPVSDLIGVRLAAMYHDQDVAGRDAIWSRRWGVAPSAKIGLAGSTSLTAGFYYLHTSELPDSGIPYLYNLANEPAGVTQTSPAQNYATLGGRQVRVPRGAFYGLEDRDFRKTNVYNFTLRAQHQFSDALTIRNTSRFGHSKQAYIVTQPDDQQGNVYGTSTATPGTSGGYVWRRANTRYGYAEGLLNQTDFFGKFDTGILKHSFAGTLEFSTERAENGSYVSNAATGTALATGSTVSPRCNDSTISRYYCTTIDSPNPSDPWVSNAGDTSTAPAGIQRSLAQTRTISTNNTKAASLFDTIGIGEKILVTLGGRYDRYETRVAAGIPAGTFAQRNYVSSRKNIWTYQAGLTFKPTIDSSLYVSTSTAATPPGTFLAQGQDANAVGTSQITANDLKVEKTKSYEVGGKINLFANALALNLALFQTKTDNARVTVENGLVAFAGRKRNRGIEFSFNGNITEQWNVFGGYTYQDATLVNGGLTATTAGTVTLYAPSANTGKPFPNTPKHSFTAFTNYKLTRKVTLGGGAIYMSKVYGGFSDQRTIANNTVVITKTRTTFVPSYWRFDANASYQILPNIGLQANVLNLTNKRYYDKAYPAHYANQAAGRTALFTLNVRY